MKLDHPAPLAPFHGRLAEVGARHARFFQAHVHQPRQREDRARQAALAERDAFERRGREYAIWGHVSDGNLHTNLIPTTMQAVHRGREAILEIASGVIGMGGAPLAEHGVGRSALKQRLLRELYGDEGIEEMRAVKRALDPAWKLAPGVLFSA